MPEPKSTTRLVRDIIAADESSPCFWFDEENPFCRLGDGTDEEVAKACWCWNKALTVLRGMAKLGIIVRDDVP